MRTGSRSFPAPVAALGLAATLACATEPDFEGYWARKEGQGDYDAYLKIQGDSGYYCVMDGKSSFRFRLVGDSITTPMNGMDAIQTTSATTLRISGREKGIPYHSDFQSMAASAYPKACDDEEAEWYGPTALSHADNRRTEPSRSTGVPGPQGGHPTLRFLSKGRWMDLLGRTP